MTINWGLSSNRTESQVQRLQSLIFKSFPKPGFTVWLKGWPKTNVCGPAKVRETNLTKSASYHAGI